MFDTNRFGQPASFLSSIAPQGNDMLNHLTPPMIVTDSIKIRKVVERLRFF